MEDIVDMQRFSYSEGASKFKLGQYYASFCQLYSHDDSFWQFSVSAGYAAMRKANFPWDRSGIAPRSGSWDKLLQ